MQTALVAVHLLAAAVWVGGVVALVFVGVPVVRTLEGESRAQAMRLLGERWRPIGWSALGVAALTGLPLAAEHGVDALVAVKATLVALLAALSYVHDYRLGPALARQIRAGEEPTLRPLLVRVGWVTLALTIALPVVGVLLAR